MARTYSADPRPLDMEVPTPFQLKPDVDARIFFVRAFPAPSKKLYTIRKLVGTTPVQVTQNVVRVRSVVVKAESGNSGTIFVGTEHGGAEPQAPTAGVDTSGFALAKSEETPRLEIESLHLIWLVGSAASQLASIIAEGMI